jgi:AraC-like DNA-binding protein
MHSTAATITRILTVARFRRPAGHRFARESPGFWTLTSPVIGQLNYRSGSAVNRLKPGDIVVSPPAHSKRAELLGPKQTELFSVQFLASGLDALIPCPLYVLGRAVEELPRLMLELESIWLHDSATRTLEAAGLLQVLLARSLRAVTEDRHTGGSGGLDSGRIGAVRRHILENLRREIDVAGLAHEFGLSPGYFGSWFKSQTGMTLHRYVNDLRVRRAMELLATQMLNVAETADECGFHDPRYFARVFSERTGMTPSEYQSKR